MITVEKMRNILNDLVEKGLGSRNISVADYFLGEEYDEGDDLWNSVTFEEIHQSEIPLTREQQKSIDDDLEKLKIKNPELFNF